MDFSKRRSELEQLFISYCQGVVEEQALEFYDIEYNSEECLLTLYVLDPKTGTALIEDCVRVDNALTFEEDWVPDNLVLEVSSPGMFRQLTARKHFEQAQGKYISCTLDGSLSEEQLALLPKNMKKKNQFRGILAEVEEDKVIINIDKIQFPLDFKQIQKANLDPDY